MATPVIRLSLAALIITLAAILGAYGKPYSGMGVHGYALGTDSCMSGIEFGDHSVSLYLCTAD